MAVNRIPNVLTLGFAGVGLLLNVTARAWAGLWFAVAGMLVGFALLVILYALRAVGAGDVKLFAAIGAISGAASVAHILVMSLMVAGVIGIVILSARKLFADRIRALIWLAARIFVLREGNISLPASKKEMVKFPFMLAVLPAAVIYLGGI